MNIILFNLLFFTKVVIVFSQSCLYVSDLKVSYYEKEDFDYLEWKQWNSTNLSGCITNTSFSSEKVEAIAIYCNVGHLPVLEKYFINNMELLRHVYIGACSLRSISAGAFFNLPQIKKININKNRISKISFGVFNVLPSLRILYVFKSQVKEIEDNAFSNLPNLDELNLNTNKIKEIKREWLTNTTNIRKFVIYRNLIRTVPFGMFHGWKKLGHLDFSSNHISTIEAPLIKDNPPYMSFIGLHRNRLRTLSLDMFSNLTIIGHLMLSGNLLNYLSDDFIRNVNVVELTIFANPFSCTCYEKMTKIFFEKEIIINKESKLTYQACKNQDVPVCGFSSNLAGTCSEVVDEDLTKRIITHMKKVQYDTVVDNLGQQCASFDYDVD